MVKEGLIYRIQFGKKGITWEEVENYGGHSRAIVSLQDHSPLHCIIYDSYRENPSLFYDSWGDPASVKYLPIQNLPSGRDTSAKNLSRLLRNLKFLPKDLQQQFIQRHELRLEKEDNGTEYLITEEDFRNPPPF